MPRSFREVVNEAKQQIREVTPDEMERLRQTGAPVLVVDVRDEEDYREGHLPGAVSIPRGALEMNIDDHTTDEERPIVCYCGGGSRSALSALSLQQMGYRNVMSLSGGFRGWKESDRPVETETADDP
ncbi:MAG: sulfurtransferase [Armatimonadetes bacterium]|nr:sulfurtransferase [Armatimonadota bacterium]